MRLIDADELEKKLARYFTGGRSGEATMRELIIDETIADDIRMISEQPTVDAIVKDDNFGFAGYISKKDETGYRVEESWNLELNDEELVCIMCGVIQDLKKHKRLNKLWMKAVDLADFIGDES